MKGTMFCPQVYAHQSRPTVCTYDSDLDLDPVPRHVLCHTMAFHERILFYVYFYVISLCFHTMVLVQNIAPRPKIPPPIKKHTHTPTESSRY